MRLLYFLLVSYFILSCSKERNRDIQSISDSLSSGTTKTNSSINNLAQFSIYPSLLIDTTIITKKESTPYKGNIFYKAGWKDQNGNNIFMISTTYIYSEGEGKAEIYAYHYIQDRSDWKLNWETYDFVDGTGCDLSIDIPESFIKITDLDSNAVAEIAYIYIHWITVAMRSLYLLK